ncbi:MAG: radical SAM protein [Anaerolineaceae bacterium]|nr:radical SAM protein [Anaerolineaceae bacterium]
MREITLADIASALSDEALQLILMPTEQCNFRCVYCYENFRLSTMTPSIVSGVKNFLSSRFDNLTLLVISWFGGEPLLALDVIALVSKHIRSLLHSYPSVCYKASITTNGYLLTADVFRKLLDWGVFTYQISFDGPKEHHDQKRILVNGNPTFDRLWRNLKEMKTFTDKFAVTVRLHVDRDNIEQVPAFLWQFKNEFGNDDRFAVYAKELCQFSMSHNRALKFFDLENADYVMKNIRRFAESLNIPIRVPDREYHGFYSTCFSAKLNSFVIRSNGQINKCIVALDNDANLVGAINENGTLSLDRMKLLAWARGLSSGVTQELECPLRGIDSWDRKLS